MQTNKIIMLGLPGTSAPSSSLQICVILPITVMNRIGPHGAALSESDPHWKPVQLTASDETSQQTSPGPDTPFSWRTLPQTREARVKVTTT